MNDAVWSARGSGRQIPSARSAARYADSFPLLHERPAEAGVLLATAAYRGLGCGCAAPCHDSEVPQQLGWTNAEGRRDLDDDREGRHVIAAFDESDIRGAHLGALRELFLSQPTTLTQSPNDSPELLRFGTPRFPVRHPCKLTIVNLHCLVTILKVAPQEASAIRGDERV